MLFAVEECRAAKCILCFLNLQTQLQASSSTSLSLHLPLLALPVPPETSLHLVSLTS